MTREEIVKSINQEIADEYGVDASVINPDAVIFDTLNLDSLSLVDLVGIVQFKCKVLIPSAELKSIKTFSDLYDYVESHLPDNNKQ